MSTRRLTDGEWRMLQGDTLDRCVEMLMAGLFAQGEEVRDDMADLTETVGPLAGVTLFSMLWDVFNQLPADLKDWHLQSWQERSVLLRADLDDGA